MGVANIQIHIVIYIHSLHINIYIIVSELLIPDGLNVKLSQAHFLPTLLLNDLYEKSRMPWALDDFC